MATMQSFHCNYCNRSFGRKCDWRRHLLEERHQSLCRDRWGSEFDKERCLVVFSNGEVGEKVDAALNPFFREGSQGKDEFLVRNYLWWRDRMRIKIVAFGSREEADRAFMSREAEFTEGMELKRAAEMSQFEWPALFPENVAKRLDATCKTESYPPPAAGPGRGKRPLEVISSSGTPEIEYDGSGRGPSKKQKVTSENIADKRDNGIPVTYVWLVRDLAERRNWLRPQFRVSKVGGKSKNNHTWCGVALVNGVEWARNTAYHAFDQRNAMEQIAEAAYHTILREMPGDDGIDAMEYATLPAKLGEDNDKARWEHGTAAQNAFDSTDKDNHVVQPIVIKTEKGEAVGEVDPIPQVPPTFCATEINAIACPIRKLEALAIANGCEKPQYFTFRRPINSDGQISLAFSSRMVVNGVEYQPDIRTSMYPSKTEAMNHISLRCLGTLMDAIVKKEVVQPWEQDSLPTNSFFQVCSDDPPLPPTGRSEEYWALRKSMVVPYDQHKTLVTVIKSLKKFICDKEADYHGVLVGNCALRITNDTQGNVTPNEPLVYIYSTKQREQTADNHSLSWISHLDMLEIFGTGQSETKRNPFSLINSPVKVEPGMTPDQKWSIVHNESGTRISITSLKSQLLEVQTHSLLEYLCTFDIRCHHLIALAQYWADTNSIHFGGTEDQNSSSYHTQRSSLSEALTLQWLVISFLCLKGILPTPREIQQRSHLPLIDPVSGADIGFHADPAFAQNWASPKSDVKRMTSNEDCDDIGNEVLDLFAQFLRVIYNKRKRDDRTKSWILNTRDAEWISEKLFCTVRPYPNATIQWFSNMSLTEISALQQVLIDFQNTSEPVDKQQQGFSKELRQQASGWYMTNPFVVTERFQLSNNLPSILTLTDCTFMKLTNNVLKRESIIGNGEQEILTESKATLVDSLKIGKDDRTKCLEQVFFLTREPPKRRRGCRGRKKRKNRAND